MALKILWSDEQTKTDTEETGAERLLREGRAAASIQHPNAVAIFDVGESNGTSFMAMELIEGRTLRAFVGDASIALTTRARWLLEIASALAAAHKRGVVHRDIKPENVIIDDARAAKVLDFGIARRATGGVPVELTSRDTTIYGSPRYMAPEQLRGEPLDGAADQFAWAVLAFELLTGRHPWEGVTTDVELAKAILGRKLAAPSLYNAHVPAALDRIVLRASQKEAAARHASMNDVMAALRSVLKALDPEEDDPLPPTEAASSKGFRSATTRTFGLTARTGSASLSPPKIARGVAGLAALAAGATLALYVLRKPRAPIDAPIDASQAVVASSPVVEAPAIDAGLAEASAPEPVEKAHSKPSMRPKASAAAPPPHAVAPAPAPSPPPAPPSEPRVPTINTAW